ncbi:MAG: NifB/NifX family molybdenum-iron cluster-binding protein [Syntrophobacteraceae bacterium]
MKKVLLALDGNDIAPRFDLAPEVLILSVGPDSKSAEEKTVVLPRPSAEILCHIATAENIETVICGGIEEEYLQYLGWKKIEVLHSVIGPAETALTRYLAGDLKSGDILFERRKA